MDCLFREHGSRFGNATRVAGITMSGLAGPISRATRIFRDTGPRRLIRTAFDRNHERTDLALPLARMHDPLTIC
jgi:hypothetical protein